MTLNARISTNSGEATVALLREGAGLSLTPLWIVREHLQAGRLKVVLPEYSVRRTGVYAVYPEAKHLLPKVRMLVDSLVADFATTDWATVRSGWIAAA